MVRPQQRGRERKILLGARLASAFQTPYEMRPIRECSPFAVLDLGSSRISRVTTLAALWLIAASLANPLKGQSSSGDSPIGALKQLSVEQLMDIEVTSVSKEPEKLLDAASAIQVITSDDIETAGVSSIPEALRLADNLEVAQENSHDWAISARGFDANLADKLLVLIDGRAVYSPLYGGVEWNVQDYLMADVDRIEVISGPGGTLWGANAVNGVINITTKSAKDTQGLYMEEDAGNELQNLTAVRYGGILGPNVYFRVYAEFEDRGSEVFGDGTKASDSFQMSRGGFRVDSNATAQTTLTLQGDFYSGTEYEGALGDAGLQGGNLLGRWSHTLSNDSDMSIQVYYDRTHLSQPFAASTPAPPYYTGFPAAPLTDDLDTYDIEFQHNLRLGASNKFVWGLGYRFTHEFDEDISVVRFLPPSLSQSLYSGFVQDEWTLRSDLVLTAGTKLEHNDYTGLEVEPNIRLSWNLPEKQMLWAAVSRAVRTPSRYDHDLAVVTGLVNAPYPYMFPNEYLAGSDDFKSETLVAYEVGYRAELGSNVSVSVSAFYNDYDDLRSTATTPTTATYIYPYPVVFGNNLEGDTYGLELTANFQPTPWWRLKAGYDLLMEDIHAKAGFVDATGALNETADPKNQASLSSSMDLPRAVQLYAALRWVGSLTINNGPTAGPVAGTVPSYFELNARVAWHATKNLVLSLVGENLLHDHHQEYGYPSPTTEEIERSVFAKAEWRY
jgi:iron complex outermembrane receptor protein